MFAIAILRLVRYILTSALSLGARRQGKLRKQGERRNTEFNNGRLIAEGTSVGSHPCSLLSAFCLQTINFVPHLFKNCYINLENEMYHANVSKNQYRIKKYKIHLICIKKYKIHLICIKKYKIYLICIKKYKIYLICILNFVLFCSLINKNLDFDVKCALTKSSTNLNES